MVCLASVSSRHWKKSFTCASVTSHDLWHVVTGYGRDQLGELALLAVYYRQISNPGFPMMIVLFMRAGRKEYPDIGI